MADENQQTQQTPEATGGAENTQNEINTTETVTVSGSKETVGEPGDQAVFGTSEENNDNASPDAAKDDIFGAASDTDLEGEVEIESETEEEQELEKQISDYETGGPTDFSDYVADEYEGPDIYGATLEEDISKDDMEKGGTKATITEGIGEEQSVFKELPLTAEATLTKTDFERIYMTTDEEEEEESVIEEEESVEEEIEESIVIEREPLYESYKKNIPQYNGIKLKNNFLQKKMVEYFSKRKMDHVMKEDSNYEDNYHKYTKKLDTFYRLKEAINRNKTTLAVEISHMKTVKTDQNEQLNESYEKMVNREKEIGVGLILAKTGKEIPEKYVLRLLSNQEAKIEELSNLRLQYIKLRDNTTEKEIALEALDKVGDQYTLMDYEQLKVERRNHNDKIEERDEELSRLRVSCSSAIQCLAHIREKSSATQHEIHLTTAELATVEAQKTVMREQVNESKKQRDKYRMFSSKLKEEAGLLTKPKLLQDMQNHMDERDNLLTELEQLKETHEKYRTSINALKKNIKKLHHKVVTIKKPKCEEISKKPSRIYKGRPSLLSVPQNACDDFF